jgi:DNA-binding LytR/AlgR family response regulator
MLNFLIIEDNEDERKSVEKLCLSEFDNINPICVDNASAALERIKCGDIDVYVVDYCLSSSGMNGEEIIRIIRETDSFSYIIVFSAYANELQQESRLHIQYKRITFLQKPSSNEEIIMLFKNISEEALNCGRRELSFDSNIGYEVIQIENVLYIENDSDMRLICIYIVVGDEIVDVKKIKYYSFSKIYEGLRVKGDLIKCHKSFLVNPDKVRDID